LYCYYQPMKHNYTPLDFLLYHYKEMSAEEIPAFEAWMFADTEGRKEYAALIEDIALLDKAQLSPSGELVNDLLKRLQINHSEEVL
jgi:hypothetical protein